MEIEIDPLNVFYSQDSIRPRFKDNNRHVEETIKQLVKGKITPRHIERIRICFHNGRMHSLDNRRLYVFKQAVKRGGNFKTVPAVRSYNYEELQRKMSESSPYNDWSVIRVRRDTLSYNYNRYSYETDEDEDSDDDTTLNYARYTFTTTTKQYVNTNTNPQATTNAHTTNRQNTEEQDKKGFWQIIASFFGFS
ncbi:hypothetical protein RclHR1_03080003 [Rhizophagus clarus]|uniref:RHS repeat-associated core domain-containing protein n=1 Tax=Rhizophagus clarus TaxID=94130 RepID=A0A2Z6RIC9_9GLOM|nr:hypothetical protein RclHR1_03080003 [Rhizophagus clarus]GES86418.1 RHS repeat-associated core domain-containing protein [Rhizophagus clarus]